MKKSVLRTLRRQAERFPLAAESYRVLRDNLAFRRMLPAPIPAGFKLMGNAKAAAGTFEVAETELVRELVRGCDVFVDIGANVGYYSCLARAAGLRVLAFEPSPVTLRTLCANLVANDFQDVEVLPIGLTASAGIATLYGMGGSASLRSGWSDTRHAVLVPTSTLDNVLAGRFLGQRLMVKLDIEGHEHECLRGAEEVLARTPAPVWLVEIYPTAGAIGGPNPHFAETFGVFWRHGYRAHHAQRGGAIVDARGVEDMATGRQVPPTWNFVFSR